MNEPTSNLFTELRQRFEKLSPGDQAALRRVEEPKDLLASGLFYRLCQRSEGLSQLARVVFILPWLRHVEKRSLGAVLYNSALSQVSEARIIQMTRSEEPQDLVTLRRIIWQAAGRHAEQGTDWDVLGRQLYYWGEKSKQQILKDYFLAEIAGNNKEEE